MADINEQLDSLAATAMLIARDRQALLIALRSVINAADIHGASSTEYALSRRNAIELLEGFSKASGTHAAAGNNKEGK